MDGQLQIRRTIAPFHRRWFKTLIKTLKDRLDKTKEYLSKKSLLPLPDDLKNPLNFGEKAVAEKADVESVEDNLRYRMWVYENEKDNEGWLEGDLELRFR